MPNGRIQEPMSPYRALPLLGLALAGSAAAQVPALTRAATIGCDFCEGPEAFGSIEALTLGPGGVIVVADRDAPKLRVFDVDGPLRWSAAREGDGPGELRLPIAVAVTSAGGVLSLDMRQLRLSRWDAAGTFGGSLPVSVYPLAMSYDRATERLLLTTTNFRGGAAVVALNGTGAVDTVLSPLPFADVRGNQFAKAVVRPDGGFALGEGRESYRINVYRAEGTLLYPIARDVTRPRRTPEELDRLRQRLLAGGRRAAAEGGGSGPPPVDPLRPHFTALDALAYDDAGRLWVRTERGGAGATLFDLFDRSGAYLGELVVDLEVEQFALADGYLAGAVSSPEGTQRVVVWRVAG
jgi:hypothetical protein